MSGRNVIFSPHCDDAFLAMGGYILQSPQDFHVVDIFGTCAWTTTDQNFTSEELTRINQSEERAVAQKAGVGLTIYEYPEALLRNYRKWNAKRLHSSDVALAKNILETIKHHALGASRVYFPLAPGHHVDHVIVHNQMPVLYELLIDSGVEVYLYEDLPYSWYGDVEERISTLKRHYTLKPTLIDISDVYVRKEALLSLYASQLGEDELRKVKEYGASLKKDSYSEVLWQVLKS